MIHNCEIQDEGTDDIASLIMWPDDIFGGQVFSGAFRSIE